MSIVQNLNRVQYILRVHTGYGDVIECDLPGFADWVKATRAAAKLASELAGCGYDTVMGPSRLAGDVLETIGSLARIQDQIPDPLSCVVEVWDFRRRIRMSHETVQSFAALAVMT